MLHSPLMRRNHTKSLIHNPQPWVLDDATGFPGIVSNRKVVNKVPVARSNSRKVHDREQVKLVAMSTASERS